MKVLEVLKNRVLGSPLGAWLVVGLTSSALIGCALLAPAKSVAEEVFECEVAVLEPAVGRVLDTVELVRGVYMGQANAFNALIAVGKTPDEARAIADEFRKCDPRSKLTAAPPAYGNRIVGSELH